MGLCLAHHFRNYYLSKVEAYLLYLWATSISLRRVHQEYIGKVCVCVCAHSCGGVYLAEWAWLQWSIAMQHKSPAWEPSSHQASKLLTKCSIPHVGSDWLLEYDSIFHVEAEMRKSSQNISIKERHNRIIVMTFRHWELILMCDCCWCNKTGGAWMPACSDSHHESWVSFILRMLSHEQSVLYLELRRS